MSPPKKNICVPRFSSSFLCSKRKLPPKKSHLDLFTQFRHGDVETHIMSVGGLDLQGFVGGIIVRVFCWCWRLVVWENLIPWASSKWPSSLDVFSPRSLVLKNRRKNSWGLYDVNVNVFGLQLWNSQEFPWLFCCKFLGGGWRSFRSFQGMTFPFNLGWFSGFVSAFRGVICQQHVQLVTQC